MVTNDQRNIPAFHRYWPLFTYSSDELFGFEESGFVGLDALRRGQGVAQANVAEAGGRFGGLDADGDNELPAPGQIKRVGQDLLEFLFLSNDMVGRQDGHDGAGGALPDDGRAQGDCGAGVAPDGFGDDILPGQFGQLPPDFRRLDGVGDDENVFEGNQRQDAIDSLLEQGALAKQGDELFGGAFAADGPEAFAAPSGHDDDVTVLRRRFHIMLILDCIQQ
jgi:hypothetical protein